MNKRHTKTGIVKIKADVFQSGLYGYIAGLITVPMAYSLFLGCMNFFEWLVK